MVILTSLCLMEIGCHGRSVGQVESRLELIDRLTALIPPSWDWNPCAASR